MKFSKYITNYQTPERIWWLEEGNYCYFQLESLTRCVNGTFIDYQKTKSAWSISKVESFDDNFHNYTINHALNATPNCPQQFPIIKEFLKDIVRGLHEIS